MADDPAKGGLIPKLVKPEIPIIPDPEPVPVAEMSPEGKAFRDGIANFTNSRIAAVEEMDAARNAPPDFEASATIRGKAMLNDPALMARVAEMQGEYGVPRNDVLAWEDIAAAPTTMEKGLRAAQFSRHKGDAFARFADHMFGAYTTETQADTARRGQDMTQITQGGNQVIGTYDSEANRQNAANISNSENQTRVNVANNNAKLSEYEANRRVYDNANEPSDVKRRDESVAEAKGRPLGVNRALLVGQFMGLDGSAMTPEQQQALGDVLMPAINEHLLDTNKPITKAVDELRVVVPKNMEYNDFAAYLGFTPDQEISPQQEQRIKFAYKRVTGREPPRDSMWSYFGVESSPSFFQNVVVPEENIDNMPPEQ